MEQGLFAVPLRGGGKNLFGAYPQLRVIQRSPPLLVCDVRWACGLYSAAPFAVATGFTRQQQQGNDRSKLCVYVWACMHVGVCG